MRSDGQGQRGARRHDLSGGDTGRHVVTFKGLNLWPAAAILVLVGLGTGFRVAVLSGRWGALGELNSDEAVVGLMARHLLNGEFHVFYWGQIYGGSQEAILTALLMTVLGPTVVAIKLTPVLLSAVAAVLTWRVGRRTIGTKGAVVAALLFWVWPTAYLFLSTFELGFYEFTMVCGLLLVLFSLRVVQEPGRRLDWAILGFAAGMGWWASPNIVYFGLPAVIWLLSRASGQLIRFLPVSLPAALLGAAPWLAFNVVNRMASLHAPTIDPYNEGHLGHVISLFRIGLPVALGVHSPFFDMWIWGAGGIAMYAGAATLVLLFIARARGPRLLVVLVLLIYPVVIFVFPGSPRGSARYVMFAAPFLALALCGVSSHIRYWAPLTLVALAITFSGFTYIPLSPDVAPLVRTLDQHGISGVVANYWVAYRLSFLTGERIVALPYHDSRYPAYATKVRSGPSVAYVFESGSPEEDAFVHTLQAQRITFEKFGAATYDVMVPAVKLEPEQVPGP